MLIYNQRQLVGPWGIWTKPRWFSIYWHSGAEVSLPITNIFLDKSLKFNRLIEVVVILTNSKLSVTSLLMCFWIFINAVHYPLNAFRSSNWTLPSCSRQFADSTSLLKVWYQMENFLMKDLLHIIKCLLS